MENAIKVQNLGKKYRIGSSVIPKSSKNDNHWWWLQFPINYLLTMLRPPSEKEILWAIRNISFDVKPGETLGIVGSNGAGKSTLLKVLSRITEPTEGRARIKGRVGSLLEVGTGFHPQLTGRENIYLKGSIMGMKKDEIQQKFDEIVDFTGVEKFLDTPIKRYSSGMHVRLAFSVAANLLPEILIIDEVLAVGDIRFRKKSIKKMTEIVNSGRTIIIVSHNMDDILSLADRVIWLDSGRLILDGSPQDVIDQYRAGSLDANKSFIN